MNRFRLRRKRGTTRGRPPHGQGSALLALLIPVALSLGCAGLAGERQATTSVPVVRLSDLLLSREELPKGWWSQGPAASVTEHHPDANEALSTSFRSVGDGGVAVHLVLRYKDASLAARELDAERSYTFRSHHRTVKPWEPPGDMHYRSPTADEFVCACTTERDPSGTDREVTICVAIARYGQYVSEFSSWLSPKRMSVADFERVLRRIDQRVSTAVQKATPPSEATPAGVGQTRSARILLRVRSQYAARAQRAARSLRIRGGYARLLGLLRRAGGLVVKVVVSPLDAIVPMSACSAWSLPSRGPGFGTLIRIVARGLAGNTVHATQIKAGSGGRGNPFYVVIPAQEPGCCPTPTIDRYSLTVRDLGQEEVQVLHRGSAWAAFRPAVESAAARCLAHGSKCPI